MLRSSRAARQLLLAACQHELTPADMATPLRLLVQAGDASVVPAACGVKLALPQQPFLLLCRALHLSNLSRFSTADDQVSPVQSPERHTPVGHGVLRSHTSRTTHPRDSRTQTHNHNNRPVPLDEGWLAQLVATSLRGKQHRQNILAREHWYTSQQRGDGKEDTCFEEMRAVLRLHQPELVDALWQTWKVALPLHDWQLLHHCCRSAGYHCLCSRHRKYCLPSQLQM